ncbi:hypothetical protein [Mesorhizobium xinjiangense]|uniref:hypothetical protein n=1 Tax=Mesorhizobium xinjiangense TaxID=2678685 RepID=UPI0012EE19CB|nr:hypothetical protein [Mesorhizobium xinjiangense]
MKFSPGDIVEIRTPGGFSYVQVTHNHPSYPEVVRALPGLHGKRPTEFDMLARSQSAFVAMIPLGGAIEKRRIEGERVARTSIPEEHAAFPTFRMPIHDKQGGVAYWWFWDGQGLRYSTEPDADAEKYPMREVMSVEAFLKKLA